MSITILSDSEYAAERGQIEQPARAKRTDADRMEFEPFRGDRDVDIQCRTVKMVTTRKPHPCMVGCLIENHHDIAPGTRAVCESAKIDGEFGSCYYCVECLDKLMDAEAAYEAGFSD